MSGKTYKNWKVIERDYEIYWKCKCSKCNLEKIIDGYKLRTGQYIKCFCNTIDGIFGKSFGRVTVIGIVPKLTKHGDKIKVKCKCNNCGKEEELIKKSLISGKNVGCRCINYGKKYKNSGGYITVYDPNNISAGKNGCVFEHRIVMEKKLGRQLNPFESIHHKNGIRDDNSPENLELWTKHQPPGQRVEDVYNFCKRFIEKYKDICEPIV